jgi:hypothetical protein
MSSTIQVRKFEEYIVFGKNTKTRHPSMSLSERSDANTKVLSGHKEALIRTILEGWRIQYNYYRNNKSLSGKTPGRQAGVFFKYNHGHLETIA